MQNTSKITAGDTAVTPARARGGLVSRTNLLTRLLILVAVATLPAVLVMAYMQQNLREEGRERIAGEAMRQAELLNADISNIVEGARQLSLAISHFTSVTTADPACRADLEHLRVDLPSYTMIAIVGADGQLVCTTEPAAAAFVGAAEVAHVRDILVHGRFDVGTFMPATASRGPVLPLCLPFTMASGRQAVVVLGLSLDWLGAHLGELKRPADSTIGIADRTGTTVARFPDHDRFVGKLFPPAVRPLMNASQRGNAVVMGYDGKERLIGFIPAGDGPVGLFVSIGMYLPGMLAELDRTTMQGTLLIAAGALLSLILALFVGQRFVRRPTETLLAAAKRWTAGDLSARARLREGNGSEFGSLAVAFNAMAGALDTQRKELESLNSNLEDRVASRTQDLSESRNRLQVEMAEREKTEASLRQAQKLQAVGQLSGGIAHDFNNLLTAIVGALDLMRSRMPPGQDSLIRLVDNALQAAERGGKLTGQLLSFSRRQRLMPTPTDLNMTVVSLSNLLGSTLGRSIRIQTDLVQDLWPAMIDPGQIEAAIINLAINARDAMPDGGVLTLATRNITHNIGGTMAPGEYVAVRVSDTGTGMTPDVLAHVFEPFFTTKGPGRGSGLGLSQVHGLAKQSGGDIRIESSPGSGTTVTLLMPRAATMPDARQDPMSGRNAPRRRARVLVVDDDNDVRQMTGEMLKERGYAAELVASAEDALALLQRDNSFDIALVDYVMPGVNGMTLVDRLQAERPALRTLLMTGHAEMEEDIAAPPDNIIRKPFNIATLDERIDRLLSRPLLRSVAGGKSEAS
jgi:signal transduction histidine kinase/CheY-like chemotaxis protein